MVGDFFVSGKLPPGTNETLIVLIAKTAKPVCISQYRPINLCNVFYKTISKVMVNRLKPLMSEIVIKPHAEQYYPGTDDI